MRMEFIIYIFAASIVGALVIPTFASEILGKQISPVWTGIFIFVILNLIMLVVSTRALKKYIKENSPEKK